MFYIKFGAAGIFLTALLIRFCVCSSQFPISGYEFNNPEQIPGNCSCINKTFSCDFTSTQKSYSVNAFYYNGSCTKLRMINGTDIKLQLPNPFKTVIIVGSNKLDAIAKTNPYRLEIQETQNAIIKSGISYFKAVNSSVKELVLDVEIGEVDLINTQVNKFSAISWNISNSIIDSRIDLFNFTCRNNCYIQIQNSTVGTLEIFNVTTENNNVTDSTFQYIPANGLTISKKGALRMTNVTFESLTSRSIIVEGKLTIQAAVLPLIFPIDWLIIEPGGTVIISIIHNETEKIINMENTGNEEITPFEMTSALTSRPIATYIVIGALWGITFIALLYMTIIYCLTLYRKSFNALKRTDLPDEVKLEEKLDHATMTLPKNAAVSNNYIIQEPSSPVEFKNNIEDDIVEYRETEMTQSPELDQSGEYRDTEAIVECQNKISPVSQNKSLKNLFGTKKSFDIQQKKPAAPLPPSDVIIKPNDSFLQKMRKPVDTHQSSIDKKPKPPLPPKFHNNLLPQLPASQMKSNFISFASDDDYDEDNVEYDGEAV